MALVILPCDMPWWGTLQNHIKKLASTQNVDELISVMQAIHMMCNVGLDPDEPEVPDSKVLNGFKSFISDELSSAEQKHFFSVSLPAIVNAALNLKSVKPVDGLRFSLQQEVSEIEISHDFACSLIAHAFLSSFPKRTNKTHPTLQDFNFSNFFQHLDQKFQKVKLKCIFYYFDIQKRNNICVDPIKIIRQVMKGNEWLTIQDWLECSLSLCPLSIKHDNHIENAEFSNSMFVCFSSKKLGGRVLSDGSSRECVQFVTCPELLVTLLCSEALEDNEVIFVENLMQIGKINNLRIKGVFESSSSIKTLNVCCMDAENYARLPLSQYEEDNILRELNKSLLGFRQKQQQLIQRAIEHQPAARRLSPIGESFSTTPTENYNSSNKQINKQKENQKKFGTKITKGRFIVLGSSGELLPVSRPDFSSKYSTCHSDESSTPEEFYSARSSGCESDEEAHVRRYSGQLDTPTARNSFAERLREALCRAQTNSSTDSSYAVDISVTGSSVADPNIRMKRGGSRGFMLEEDSFDVSRKSQCKNQSVENEENIHNSSFNTRTELTRNKGGSSRYSFSTDYNSDLDEVYEQLNHWVEESENKPSDMNSQSQKMRDNVIIQFAGGLLKRTLSESFVGVPLTDGGEGDEETNDEPPRNRKNSFQIKMAVRSLSLELAKQKHKLAAQLISVIGNKQYCDNGLKTVITGNWGCGSRNLGDPQLKLLIQWLAASVAGIPQLIYYTFNHHKLLKLDTVCRVLIDRQWNVGELVRAVIFYLQFTLSETDNTITDNDYDTLFDLLINSDEKIENIRKKFLQ